MVSIGVNMKKFFTALCVGFFLISAICIDVSAAKKSSKISKEAVQEMSDNIDNITTEDELSESRFIIIKDIFKEILMAVSDVSVKPIPKNVMFTSKPVQADEAVTVIKELSDVFANLLIANGEDEELEEKYCFIINNLTEESKDYIRLIENSNIIEYLVDNELIHI